MILAALLWGTTFVAQSTAADSVEPFTFNCCRQFLGGLVLIPVILVKNRGRLFRELPTREDKKRLLGYGLVCGFLLFLATNAQQFGIAMGTSAGKSGFITAIYVILVPVFGIFFGKRLRWPVWICVLLTAAGMYFLCMASFDAGLRGLAENFTMTKGDLVSFLCAVFFALHIMAVDRFVGKTDGVFLSCVQFLFCGFFGFLAMLLFETPSLDGILAASGAILYAAFFSCGMAYTFQILGQKYTPPVLASMIMCLESVFAVFSDLIFLKTPMSLEEVLGCLLMFVAILASQLLDALPAKARRKK